MYHLKWCQWTPSSITYSCIVYKIKNAHFVKHSKNNFFFIFILDKMNYSIISVTNV